MRGNEFNLRRHPTGIISLVQFEMLNTKTSTASSDCSTRALNGLSQITNCRLYSLVSQDGTSQLEGVNAIAPGGSEGSMVLVGYTYGSFGASNIDEVFEAVIVMVTSNQSTIEPSPAPVRPSTITITPVSPPTTAPVRPLTSVPISPTTPAPTWAYTVAPIPLPTLSPTPPSLSGTSSPALMPTSTAGATTSSGFALSTIVIAAVVPTAGVLVLLVLVSCRRRIQVRLSPRRSKPKAIALMEDNNALGLASGPVSLGGDGVDDVASGQQISLASSGAQATHGVILDSDEVQSGYGRHMAAAFSQEPSATATWQSRSTIEPTVPPRYDDVMRGGVKAAGTDEDAHAVGLGREIYEGRLNSTASKPCTSCDFDAALQLYASKEKGTGALGGRRRSCETQHGNSEGSLTTLDATEEYPSDPTNDQCVGIGQAILETARELAQASMIPAVSEAAAMISVLVRLVSDNKQSDDGADGKLRWCRAIVALLGRATDLLSKGKAFPDEVEHLFLEDVRESIDDLVQLIRTYRSKNKMVRVVTSSLFKRRQEELETAINRTLCHLQKLDDKLRLEAVERFLSGEGTCGMKAVIRKPRRTRTPRDEGQNLDL